MSAIQILIGLVVSKVEEIHDYVQIVFSDDTTLSVFNNYSYDGDSVNVIKGKKVRSIEEYRDKIVILFEGCGRLSIGLGCEDYKGPEVMVLKKEGEAPVVWS